MLKKNIVVVGGGYAGVSVINKLDGVLPSTHRIVLIEQQDFMYARLGAARASASEDIAEQVLVPYDKLFKSLDIGVVIQASVSKINPRSVVLSAPHKSFGSEVEFDYLVFEAIVSIAYCRLLQLEVPGGIPSSCIRFQGKMLWPY
jgi:NADH dehydrogenase FAD-containing subunit